MIIDYNLRDKKDLWREIELIVGCSHLSDVDQALFLELIKVWSAKK